MIVAVDGPAGAGKSTVSKLLAQKLGFIYIDTGAMYRALTLKALESGIRTNDEDALLYLAKKTSIDLKNGPDGALIVLLDGKDVSREIREPKITQFVSDVAKIKGVREIMVELQRKLGKRGSVVLDGRDIGTVVFPNAEKKFYIDANFSERVNRRYKESQELGQKVTIDSVSNDLDNRDKIDSTRVHSPLKRADDAIYVDTTNLSIEQVVEKLLKEING